MPLTAHESSTMKAKLGEIDDALLTASTASDELDDLITAATGTTPPPGGGTAPVASFTYVVPGDPAYPRKMTFTGAPAGMASYAWDFGNGVTETLAAPSNNYTYAVDGTYTVTLTVTDAAGLTGSTSQRVVVDFDPDVPPPTGGGGTEIRAELPRVQVNTTYPDQTGDGIHVPIGGDLQAAMIKAKPGDTITLANGGHWTANHYLFNHGSAAGWVVVRPDNMQHVPPPGTRLTEAMAAAAGLPVLHSPNNQGAIMTDVGAHHYRFVGIEVAPTQGVYNGGLCRMGSGAETSLTDLPHHFIFDRCYVHGIPGESARRGVVFNCGEAAVIDSTITDFHEQGADSQCVTGWNGAGPFLIENNKLAAASENVIFGGGDPSIPGLIASDVVIRRNYFTKDIAWQGGGWVVKLLIEMKAVIRCLIEGNVMEYCWADGQGGSHSNLKSVNQGGTCPDCGCEDITYRLNVIHHTGAGFMLTGNDVGATRLMTRTTIEHNVTFAMSDPKYFGDGRGFLINNNPKDVLIAHNSIFGCVNSAFTFGGPMGPTDPQPVGMRVRDNIIDAGEYGIKGPGMNCKQTLAMMPDLFMQGNVYIGGPYAIDVNELPPGNYVAPNHGAVGFAPDYSLLPSSPYKGKGTDGTDPGADMARVRAAVAGVMGPAPQIANFLR